MHASIVAPVYPVNELSTVTLPEMQVSNTVTGTF